MLPLPSPPCIKRLNSRELWKPPPATDADDIIIILSAHGNDEFFLKDDDDAANQLQMLSCWCFQKETHSTKWYSITHSKDEKSLLPNATLPFDRLKATCPLFSSFSEKVQYLRNLQQNIGRADILSPS